MDLTVCSMGFGDRSGTAGIVTMGFGTGGATVATTANTPGRPLRALLRPADRTESDADKRARRIREGTLPPDPVIVDSTPNERLALERTAKYLHESENLAKALERLRDEKREILARTAEIEAKQQERESAKRAKELLKQRQALQMHAIQEAMILEQMEVMDVAYVAAAVLMLQ